MQCYSQIRCTQFLCHSFVHLITRGAQDQHLAHRPGGGGSGGLSKNLEVNFFSAQISILWVHVA